MENIINKYFGSKIRIVEKHISYFEIINTFKSNECPICFIVKKNIEDYFQNLLYENINDIGFRKTFHNNRGFCNYHSYKFLSYSDGLAVAITHKDFLLEQIKNLNERKTQKKKKDKVKKCQICQIIKNSSEHYIGVIKHHINDPNLKKSVLDSYGFCIPHFNDLLFEIKNIPDWLVEFQEKNYSKLLTALNKYLDFCNASLNNNRPILTEFQQNSWRKIISLLFGFEGMIV